MQFVPALHNRAFTWEHNNSTRGSNNHPALRGVDLCGQEPRKAGGRGCWKAQLGQTTVLVNPEQLHLLKRGKFLEKDQQDQSTFPWWPWHKPWPSQMLGLEKTSRVGWHHFCSAAGSDGTFVLPSKVKACSSKYTHHTRSVPSPFLLCSGLYWQLLDTGTTQYLDLHFFPHPLHKKKSRAPGRSS